MSWGFNPDACHHGNDSLMCGECERERNEDRFGKPCQKVFISGVCSHPHNSSDRMHVCNYSGPFASHRHVHTCECGKAWEDLTDSQYAVAAFIKAVE